MNQEFVMCVGLKVLKLIGYNPFERTAIEDAKAVVFTSVALTMYGFTVAAMILEYDGLSSLETSVDSIPVGQQLLVKLMASFFLRDKIQQLYTMVDHKWPDDIYGDELYATLKQLSKSFKALYILYTSTIYFCATCYSCKPLLLYSRTFATNWYIPCDVAFDACYIPVLVAQNVYFFILASSAVFFDFIFYGFLFFVYCELEKIKYGFKNLKITEDTDFDDEAYEDFRKIVRHHNFILRYLESVNEIYSPQLFNHFVTMSATIVFGLFFMNKDGFPPSFVEIFRYIPYLIAYLFQLFLYCLSGNLVCDQIDAIGYAIYQSKWYVKKQTKLTKGIDIVMHTSRINKKLMIGNVWELNLITFMSVVKTSLSFQACMQAVYQVDE